MKGTTIILKPTAECNFRCKYCYHADTHYELGKMSLDLFEQIIEKTFKEYESVRIIFHGGEPLLMGYDFYVKAFEIIEKHKKNHNVTFGIQSNGFFMNEKFQELMRKHKIQPAISFDGPGELNSLRDKTQEVTKKIFELRDNGFHVNLLGVVTTENVENMIEYYEFVKKNNVRLKLNPVFKSGSAKDNPEYLLDSKVYIHNLKKLFRHWIVDEKPISHFDPLFNLTQMALQNRGHSCSQNSCLGHWVGIDHNGDIYPCGRSYTEEYRLANINDIDKISDAYTTDNFKNLLIKAIERRDYCIKHCKLFSVCQGGCNNDCLVAGDITKPCKFTCDVYKKMLPYIKKYVEEHKDKIKNPDVLYIIKGLRCEKKK